MKKLSTLLLMTLVTVAVMAAPVKSDEATRVASHFWSAVSTQPIEEIHLVSQTDFTEFFIFDVNQGSGFVIVAADDVAYPILGYSLNSPAGEMGPETRFWLGQYADEIDALAEGSVQVDPALRQYVAEEWNQLRQGSWQQPKNTNTVAQLLTTQWNQSPYYNALCPQGTPVGCTATAASQIMKFWNHPVVGNGTHTYSSSYGMLTVDFGSTTYDWDNMPNRLTSYSTSAQHQAVSTLCYHVGVSVNMNYGPDGSGAPVLGYGPSVQTALVDYFNYENTLRGIYKSSYTDATWTATLKEELDEGRPILYAGYDSEAGHAFVFDGYNSSSQFHVNWGWGGSYDGYFVVGALNPGGGGVGTNGSNTFNYNNQALIGIQPKPTLATTPSLLSFDVAGGTTTVEVRSDYGVDSNWTATTDVPWLTLTPATGLGNGTVTNMQVTVAATTEGQPRSANITIVQAADTLLLPVHQHSCHSADMCTLTVNMTDRSGDGWDDGYVSFSSTSGAIYGTASLRVGSYGTQTIQVCPDTVIVTWCGSLRDQQCGYFVENADGQMWMEHEAGSSLDTPDTIIAPCSNQGGLPTHTYLLEVEPNDSTYGYVTGADSNVHFADYRTIQAFANPGYRFVRWSDNIYDNPRDVVMVRDREFTARFSSLGDDTVQYDNNHYKTVFGGGSNFKWGIRLETTDLVARRQLTGVKFYGPARGRYTVSIYQNANNIPYAMVYEQSVNVTWRTVGTWNYVVFDTPVTIDHTRPMWIVISAPSVGAPAAMTSWCGNNNGSLYTEDGGQTWQSLPETDLGTWMIRAVMPVDHSEYTLTVSSTRPAWGTVTGGGLYRYGEMVTIQALPKDGYLFERWGDNNTLNPRKVVVTSDSIIRAFFTQSQVGVDGLAAEGIDIATQGQTLLIRGAEGRAVRVYDLMGRNLYVSEHFDGAPVRLPSTGIYMVRIDDKAARRVVVYGK